MSKLCIGFDLHNWLHKRHGGAFVKGINRRGQLCLNATNSLVNVANANDAPLIVAGDLIDSAGLVQPQFAAALRDALGQCKRPVTLLLGNHDMTADGDHSLGVYEQHTDFTDVQVCSDIAFSHGSYLSDCALGLDDVCLVPFHRDIRDERVRDVPLLVAHFGVYDDTFSAWCKRANGAWHVDALFAFMKERNIKAVLAGDWHSRSVWGRRLNNLLEPEKGYLPVEHLAADATQAFAIHGTQVIMQGGALCATGHDNPGLHGYGTVALWDTDEHRLSWRELPGPRFCVARSDEEEKDIVDEAQRLGHNLYLRRYYSGDKPAAPQGVEAYEALPVAVEKAALHAAQVHGFEEPKLELERLVTEWLEQWEDDREALEAHVRRYL